MQALNKKPTFYPALEGLRGIAIIAVIIYHNFPYGESLFGWLGVDLFFVLSGFLITGILIKSINSDKPKIFFKNFYLRRTLRIFPLYFLLLFIFLFLLPSLGFIKNEVVEYQSKYLWFIFYIQNWFFATQFPENSHFLNHFWSLAVEEQFYILWPLVIYILRKPKYLIIFLISALVFLFIYRSALWNADYTNFNYTTFYRFTRFDGIFIGSIIALISFLNKELILRNTAIIITSLAILNFIFYYANSTGDYPYLAFIGYTTFATIFGILVYELSYGNSLILKSIFSITPLKFLGRISYGVYMFHLPIHYFMRNPINIFLNNYFQLPAFTNKLLTGVITTIATILVSLLSYYFFELKFLRLKDRFR